MRLLLQIGAKVALEFRTPFVLLVSFKLAINMVDMQITPLTDT
jgi:hypothetical protein